MINRDLGLPNGISVIIPIRRTLSRLYPDELTQCFVSWTAVLRDLADSDSVKIDGTTLRQSFDRAALIAAIDMVSAWASRKRAGWDWDYLLQV